VGRNQSLCWRPRHIAFRGWRAIVVTAAAFFDLDDEW
jgi:hypothetical protein